MTSSEFCKQQYELVCEARKVLFAYCNTISEEHFSIELDFFGRGGSIRNLLVHIANTYEFWIGKEYLQKEIVFTDYKSMSNIFDIIRLFEQIDRLMQEFFITMETKAEDSVIISGKNVSALKLFSHVITHEFHHKGQVLSISRHLGYVPTDTDIMR